MVEIATMKENRKKAEDLVKLVTSAIDLILRDRYELSKKPLYIELGTQVGNGASRSATEIEGILEKLFQKPELYPPETSAAFSALKKEHTQERLAAFLGRLVNIPMESHFALSELKEANWEKILIWVDSYIARGAYLEGKIAEPVVKQLVGFSSPSLRQIEHFLDSGSTGLFSLYTVRKYADELKDHFPLIVERAERLRLIPASKNVPDNVRRYLEEATRCCIYGHFLASLLLCRSAIEAATKDRLTKCGFEHEVRAIRQDPLKSILKLAFDKDLMDEALWKQADDIRAKANKAAHSPALPDERYCVEACDITRGILQHLYE